MMKIAVATEDSAVAAHFGRCAGYTLAEVEEGKVLEKKLIPNPGHEPGFLPGYLARQGVNCIIAGGMGPRAQTLFAEQSIETVTGVSGPVDRVIDDYLAGKLKAGESMCDHPHGGHSCS